MAAPSKKKKTLSKDDLRRLMKEKRNTAKTTKKRIESPLAKYNNLDQLICVICSSHVKSELLWNAHIQGRTHKENVADLKAEKEKESQPFVRPPTPPAGNKRKLSNDTSGIDEKIAKVKHNSRSKGLPSDFFDNKKGTAKGGSALTLGDYSSSEDDDDDDDNDVDMADDPGRAPVPPPGSTANTTVGALPPDFFDSGIAPAAAAVADEPGTSQTKPASMAEKLPEGFFDDPKQDAKVRQVEYRDKMEDQWELFQRSMKEETTVSEQILEEDEETAQAERNIGEIDEQLHRWSQVDKLQKQKEDLMAKDAEKNNDGDTDNSDIDEQEFDEFLDWRTKKVWK